MDKPLHPFFPSAPAGAPAQSRLSRWLLLAVILSGTFMVTLDFFIVNVALPAIEHDLRASSAQIEFVVAGYGLANAAGLITGGRLGDLFGRRRLFAFGLALFTLASAACGLASTASFLVAARIVQGLAGALLQPQVLAMLNTLFSGADRARAFAAYGIVLGLAATLGQLIGGVLIESGFGGYGWRNCFLINIPVGTAALLLVPRFVPAVPGSAQRGLDHGGMALTALTLTSLLVPLIVGREQGWPAWSWFALAGAAPLLALFAWHQRRQEARGRDPLIPMSLFRNRSFRISLAVIILFYAGNASFYFVLALYLQQGLGLDALEGGLVFAVLAAGFFAASMRTAALRAALGPQAIAAGALLLAAGHAAQILLLVIFPGDGISLAKLLALPVLLVEGAGIGMVMAPLVSESLARLAPEHAGVASGVLAMMQQVGNALGVALIGIIFYHHVPAASDSHANDPAFAACLVYLCALALAVAAMLQLLQKIDGKASRLPA